MGRITRVHGLRGEVLVRLLTDRTERVEPGAVLHTDDGRALHVAASRPHQGGWLVSFEGVAGREAAEALGAVTLLAEPLDDPDALWVHDLIGSTVVDVAGNEHGQVQAVEANPASDLLVLEGGGLVPLRFVVEQRPGTVVVDVPPGLLDDDGA